MLALSFRAQIIVGVTLVTLMAATRGHHFAALEHVPSASWAVFYLAGAYLGPFWVFPGLLAEAAFLDFAAVTWGGVSNFCVSPAYVFLVPAYGALWLAGRWYGGMRRDMAAALCSLGTSLIVGTVVCELISSGSFYFLSSRFHQPNLFQFALRFVEYFPRSLSATVFYAGTAGVLHLGWRAWCMSDAESVPYGTHE